MLNLVAPCDIISAMPSIDKDIASFIDGDMGVSDVTDAHEPGAIGDRLGCMTDVETRTLVDKLYSIADHYIDKNLFADGLAFIEAFLMVEGHPPRVDGEAWLLGSEFHAHSNRFREALAHLDNARTIFEGIGDTTKLLRIHTDASAFLKRLGDFGRARDEAAAGIELAQSGDYAKWEMRLWNNLGLALKDIGDDPGAIDALRKSVELAKKLGNQAVLAANLVNIGNLYEGLGRIAEAVEFMERAKDEWEKLGNGREVARCLNNLGNFLRNDDRTKALDFLRQGLELSKQANYADVEAMIHFNLGLIHQSDGRFDDARGEFEHSRTVSDSFGDEENVWRTNRALGRLSLDEGKPDDARRSLSAAAEKLAESRLKLASDTDRVSFLVEWESLFSDLVEADLASGDEMAAIADIQRVKALALYELMTGRDAPPIDINELEALAAELGEKGVVAADYFIVGEHILIGTLSRDGVQLRQAVFNADEFEKAAAVVRDKIKAFEVSEELRAQAVRKDAALDAALEKIYGMIIGPIDDVLDGAMYLAIAPHGRIAGLPFSALRSGGAYLAERMPVAVFPNLAATGRLLGLEPKNLEGFSLSYVAGESGDLEALGAEAEAVRRSFPGMVKAHAADRLEALTSADGDWLHYSGHAVFTSAAGPEPRIELGGGKSMPFVESGSPVPEVAVLSACQTALGEMRGASEMLGFARTLFAGGGRALVAAMWQVADRQTAEVMDDFYSALVSQNSVASALSSAMRRAVARGWHPYFWAAFSCAGDMMFAKQEDLESINV